MSRFTFRDPKACAYCRARTTHLCDYQVRYIAPDKPERIGSCKMPCCEKHIVHQLNGRDYCENHQKILSTMEQLGQ